jgi:hypothetical protein
MGKSAALSWINSSPGDKIWQLTDQKI